MSSSKFTDFYQLFPTPDNSTRVVLANIYSLTLSLAFKSVNIEFYISIFGVILTIFHLIVLTRKPMRTSSIMSLMITTAICDLVSMIVAMSVKDIILSFVPSECTPPVSLFTYQLFNLLQSIRDDVVRCSTWLSVLMALIRLVTLKWSIKGYQSISISTFLFGFQVSGVAFFISSFFSCFFWLKRKLEQVGEWNPGASCPDQTSRGLPVYEIHVSDYFTSHSDLLLRIYMFLNGTTSKILPCLLFPLLAILLVLELRRNAANSRKSSTVSNKNNNTERTTGLVVFMSLTFFIALLPSGIVTSLQAIYTDKGFLYMSTYIDHICYAMLNVNASLHCLTCFAMSSQYRKTVRGVLRIPKGSVVRHETRGINCSPVST